MKPRGRGPTFLQILLAANLVVLLVPVGAFLGLRLFDNYLVRLTERRLIAESVVVAEAWRGTLLAERGIDVAVPTFRPPDQLHRDFVPIEPILDLRDGTLPPPPAGRTQATSPDPSVVRAGARMIAQLERAQVFNLSGARILDARGCVVASSRGELGLCFDHLPEVRRALAGHYTAAARRRVSDEPEPPLTSISRRGTLRVFTQTPVFVDGRVVGVVRMSRTAISAEKLLWDDRNRILQALLACLVGVPLVTFGASYWLARPVAAITRKAQAVARGESAGELVPSGLVPSEVHVLGGALEEMLARLRERTDYVQEFASNVSHELRTPLTSIVGAVELLRDDWQTMEPAQRERFLANIDADTRRMQALLVGLRELARIENEPAPEELVELRPFLDDLLGRVAPGVECDVSGAPSSLRAHRGHLDMALSNLLENALQHGGGRVSLRVAGDADAVRFEVRDRGPGMPAADRERVFERFFTTRRDAGGTGLGLAIARAVARQHGGDLVLDRGADATTFILRLPAGR